MSKARTLNPYDMEARIHSLEENSGGGGETTDAAKRSDIATEFSAETSYTAGNYVYYEGKLYIFNVDHAAGEWDATDVAEANVTDEVTSNKAAIDQLDTAVSGKSTVTANPEGTAAGDLSSIGINGTKYDIPSGGGGGITTQHLESETTDGNGVIFLDLSVDDYVLVGVSTKDFSAGWGPLFEIGCWQSSGSYKYAVKLLDVNGQAKASSNFEIDVAYMARPTT